MNIQDEIHQRTSNSGKIHRQSANILASEVVQTVRMPRAIYIERAKGSRITDVDGNEYIDLTMGYGTHILGHAPDAVVEAVQRQAARGLQYGLHNPHQTRLAELICEIVPFAEEVVFTNSGTEATMYAVRAARALTGKDRIGLFDGSYHGVHDAVLAGVDPGSSRERPRARLKGAGIPARTLDDVQMLPYRSEKAFDLVREHRAELAAVLVEPIQSSNPRLDTKEWLHQLRDVCRECGVLLILDEVVTGFTLALGGGQERFDFDADLVTFGKALGGGMPIGAVVGGHDLMSVFGPGARNAGRKGEGGARTRIFTGTSFAGNPLAMCAGIAALEEMRDREDEIYAHIESQTSRFAFEVNAFLEKEAIPAQVLHGGSMILLPFQTGPIDSARDVRGEHPELENEFYLHLLKRGVLVPGIHVAFFSAAHTIEDVDHIIAAYIESFRALREAGKI